MFSRRLSTGLFFLLWLVASSNPRTVANEQDGIAFFETHIRPLLAERCYDCHSVRADSREGNLLLDHQAGIAQGGDNGPALIPGDVDGSLLIRAVRYDDDTLQMPPDRRLSDDEIKHLETWIRMGAPDPRRRQANEPIVPRPSDPVAGRSHWAFRPVELHPRLAARNTAWPRSPIDSYILSKLDAVGLKPRPDVDRRALLNRLCFQLTGLPPTQQQTRRFLSDSRPDAVEQLVDQLLSSPQFGECWGRHWLDLARYADSNGLDENFLFREAWRYRNWVIQAINQDLPYDRFLLEQLAGDVLPFQTIEQRDRQRIAAGFLVVGPKVLLGNDTKKQRMEVADEQIDTIGRAVLGQTLGCARCHDHKFDPIPMVDYYALAGILTSTQVMEQRYMLGQQRLMERLVGLGPDGAERNSEYERYWRERDKLHKRREQAQAALKILEENDEEGLAKLIADNGDAVSATAQSKEASPDDRLDSQQQLIKELTTALDNPPSIPPRAMIPEDIESPTDERLRMAGQFDRPAETVPRGFLQVASHRPPSIPGDQSGRLELARWLTDDQYGTGHLAARVLANRIWHHLIGRGIVRTVDNFGRRGETPTHPELLDYLAARLIATEWSIKSVIREIVLSRTFALSSQYDADSFAVDPQNQWLWRANRRRITPEALRDRMLTAAGQLSRVPMDSTVWYLGDQATAVGENKVRRRTDFHCRSVYLPVIRNDLPELFEVFNFADPHATTGSRPETTGATQGLFLLNDESVINAAENLAREVIEDESLKGDQERVKRIFWRVLNDNPSPEDQRDVLGLVHRYTAEATKLPQDQRQLHAWTMACHALFSLSQFQFLE